jgi:hypothetical protein
VPVHTDRLGTLRDGLANRRTSLGPTEFVCRGNQHRTSGESVCVGAHRIGATLGFGNRHQSLGPRYGDVRQVLGGDGRDFRGHDVSFRWATGWWQWTVRSPSPPFGMFPEKHSERAMACLAWRAPLSGHYWLSRFVVVVVVAPVSRIPLPARTTLAGSGEHGSFGGLYSRVPLSPCHRKMVATRFPVGLLRSRTVSSCRNPPDSPGPPVPAVLALRRRTARPPTGGLRPRRSPVLLRFPGRYFRPCPRSPGSVRRYGAERERIYGWPVVMSTGNCVTLVTRYLHSANINFV